MTLNNSRETTEKWTKEMRLMVALKAALWTNGNEDAFLQRAAQQHREEIPLRHECCFECNTETDERFADYEIPDGRHVIVSGVPTMICPSCGHKEWDINVLAALEQIAETLPPNTRLTLNDLLNTGLIN